MGIHETVAAVGSIVVRGVSSIGGHAASPTIVVTVVLLGVIGAAVVMVVVATL